MPQPLDPGASAWNAPTGFLPERRPMMNSDNISGNPISSTMVR